MNQVTHKQHYVWRAYLKPWCKTDKDLIWWNNHKIVRNTNVFDILRDKDFYEYKPLNKLELYTVKNMFFKSKQEPVVQANKNLELIVELGGMLSQFKIDDKLHDELINIGEEIQSNVEKSGIVFLNSLKNEDLSFFTEEKDERIAFLIFILFQYFRTKSIRDNVLARMTPTTDKLKELYKKEIEPNMDYSVDWVSIYNYGYISMINAVLYNFLLKKPSIKLLKARNLRFIVSDQPVYNIADNVEKDLDLFYPISPNMAIRISADIKENCIETITDNEVLEYNLKTLKKAHEFIMGAERQDVDFKF